jgi:aspartate racemase
VVAFEIMKILGLVGGLGPESTIDYYRRILDGCRKANHPVSPQIVIDSLDVQKGLYLSGNDRAGLIEYLMASIRRLCGAGVDFIAIAANTPHLVFDELVSQTPIPILSIVETCALEAERLQLERVLLLGTRFTMEATFYPQVFDRFGIEVLAPNEADRTWAHDRYVNQLLNGEFKDEVKEEFVSLIARERDDRGIDGVVLGGTELTILLGGPVVAGIPALDTTALHVSAIVASFA